MEKLQQSPIWQNWRLGWLPGGTPKPCIKRNNNIFNKLLLQLISSPTYQCKSDKNSLSLILNKLPKSKPTSPSRIKYHLKHIWPIVYQFLVELDACQHSSSNQRQYIDSQPRQAYILWVDPQHSLMDLD
ncbi:hypothetical protein INT45_012035 [Circinella minor]|uniref:Uncharacterized protein n=1 Tax=Circinella minor TaxID=1195481 RepID=A0A8H7SF76_9FUNG|nr:hypothetical protein INT45_012035 [Circinella minor]